MAETEKLDPELTEYSGPLSQGGRKIKVVSLQPQQQETSFGSTDRRVSAPQLTAGEQSNGSHTMPTREDDRVSSKEGVTTRRVMIQTPSQEGLDEEKNEERRRSNSKVEIVSKQSRPFLLFKIVEFLFAAVVVPLNMHTWPVLLVRGDIHIAMTPLIACCTFLIYCPFVFFGYLAALHTPASIMLLLDVLGGVYFTVIAATCGVYWADLEWLLGQSLEGNEAAKNDLQFIVAALKAIGVEPDLHITADKLLMQSLLCCSAATMYLGDVFLTLKYLVFRKLPLYTQHRPFMRPTAVLSTHSDLYEPPPNIRNVAKMKVKEASENP